VVVKVSVEEQVATGETYIITTCVSEISLKNPNLYGLDSIFIIRTIASYSIIMFNNMLWNDMLRALL
jgi:hypothetical protein